MISSSLHILEFRPITAICSFPITLLGYKLISSLARTTDDGEMEIVAAHLVVDPWPVLVPALCDQSLMESSMLLREYSWWLLGEWLRLSDLDVSFQHSVMRQWPWLKYPMSQMNPHSIRSYKDHAIPNELQTG